MSLEYGYIRVSTKDQNEHRQMIAMRDIGISAENIFCDKESGKNFDRPAYKKLINQISENDVVFIKSIDRLGRNYDEIRNQWDYLVHERKVDIVIIDMPLLDTRKGKDLLGTFLSDIVLNILSFVAENERNLIRQRQKEGIDAAKKRGVKFGRPVLPLPEGFEETAQNYLENKISGLAAAEKLSMSSSTFYRKIKAYQQAF